MSTNLQAQGSFSFSSSFSLSLDKPGRLEDEEENEKENDCGGGDFGWTLDTPSLQHSITPSVFVWRRCMGIEPTRDFVEPHTGFEDQERHQAAVHLLFVES